VKRIVATEPGRDSVIRQASMSDCVLRKMIAAHFF
jgi:hypothetical protein